MRIIALFVITFMMAVNFASADISTEIAEKARNATVLVANERNSNDGGFGSGVVVSPSGLVLTNYHVIHRAETLRVFFYDPKDNNYYDAEVIGVDPVADLNHQDTPVKYPAFRLSLRGLNEFGVQWIKKNHPGQIVPENIFGMIVLDIKADGWAEKHGMEKFDVVVAIDGEPINNMLDVRNIVMGRDYKPGQQVELLIIRDGHFRKIPYELTWIDFENYEDFYDESMDEKEMPRAPTPEPLPEDEQTR